jgi:hypothetical protein
MAAAAHAQPHPGVALSWSHCFGEGTGTANRAFACDTNAGVEELVGSFVLGADMANVSGNEIVINVSTAYPYAYADMPGPPSGPPLPEWWKFMNAGTCRQAALTVMFAADPANVTCQDWGQGQQVGLLGAYQIDFLGPGTARILIGESVPPASLQTLHAGIEYYSFTLRISHAKTVGTGACAGCGTPVFLALNRVRVATPTGTDDRVMSGPVDGCCSDLVSWNVAPVPTRSSSWGAVKALYR